MFQRKSRETIFNSPWIELFLDDVEDNRNHLLKYNVVHFKNESVVAVVKKGNCFLMVDAYRYPIEKVQTEFPAGSIEDGESPEEAAKREVLEETGIEISCKNISYSFYPSNGITDQKIHIIFAEYEKGELTSQDEILTCYWMEEDKLIEKVLAGEITDALTLAALLYYKLVKGA